MAQKRIVITNNQLECKKCKMVKPMTIEHWNLNKNSQSGWQTNMCRSCKNARDRERNSNPELRAISRERSQKKNPDKYKDSLKCTKCNVEKPMTKEYWKPNRAELSGWYTKMCRSCFNAYYRSRDKQNPERRREKERKYKERNPEKYAAKQKRHHESSKLRGMNQNINRKKETVRRAEEKRKTNPLRKKYERERWPRRRENGYNEKQREKNRKNPIPSRLKSNKRRIMELNAKGSHTELQLLHKLAFHGYKCYYCKCQLELKTVTLDHRIPLSRGGTDFISNIVAACRSCNSRKGRKTETEYRIYLKRINLL